MNPWGIRALISAPIYIYNRLEEENRGSYCNSENIMAKTNGEKVRKEYRENGRQS